MEATDTPQEAVEIVWCLLSFLALPMEEQRKLIDAAAGQPPTGERSLGDADLLLDALEEHHVGWMDEFPPGPAATQLFELVRTMKAPASASEFEGGEWHILRRLARDVLIEVALPLWPFGHVRLREFVEVWDGRVRSNWT